MFLYGVVLNKRNKKEEAKLMLIKALNAFPLLWDAWLELNTILDKEDQDLIKANLVDHWVKNFHVASYYIKVQQEDDSLTLNGALRQYFPDSVYILNQIGHASYLNQSFTVALNMFKRLMLIDPFRYENMDLYSNIFYIQENYGELAALAYKTFKWDKYRPETCCVLGNYYSLRGDHEKAVLYFKRAIKLDSNFLSAWTLMGHEFLELKSTPSAIEAYRAAVDIDPTDFRAWYGLGQTYEIHQFYDYASYYFANAALSRPKDARMWAALGECYQNIKKSRDASK
jgi:anaphase-promoting complex subunit 8